MSKHKHSKKKLCPIDALCSICDAIETNNIWEYWQDQLFYKLIEYYTYPEEVREDAKRTAIKWL